MKLLRAAALAAAFLCAVSPAMAKPVAAPPGYVPQQALAYGAEGDAATPVTVGTPLPTSDPTAQDALDAISAKLDEQATSLPPQGPVASANTDLTYSFVNITMTGDSTLVSATASQTTRLHALYCTVDAATTITFKSASTAISAGFKFPSGGGFINWAYDPYWRLKTATNEALILSQSGTANINCNFRYVKGA